MRHVLPAIAALSVVLAASADWSLEPAGICAKDRETCERAAWLIATGRLWPDLGRQQCRPHPGCFTPESNCIAGYNCR